jgi:hypothetical protein
MVVKKSNNPGHWLVETKFQPPLLREDIILRQLFGLYFSPEIARAAVQTVRGWAANW